MVTPTPTTVQVKIQLRGDTAANWAAVNPVLLTNELGLETDTKKLKVGDGTTAWTSLAYFPSIVTGGTVLGNLEIGTTGTLTFEGSTADGFETTLAVTDPTADRTITLPDQSGTVVVTGNASIVDADIAANAEIAVSKLANGTVNQVLVTDGTDVSWSNDLTLAGNLTVNGTTTTVNTETLTVKDKNIELAVVETPTDVTADGGGITLKGATDKTITWSDTTDAWTFNQVVDLPAGTNALPALFFNGDVDTGIYSPGADLLAISTSGTEHLRITSTGELKHIGGGTEGSPSVYFAGSAPSNSLYIQATNGSVGLGTSSVQDSSLLTLQESAALGAALALRNRNSTQTWKVAVDATAVDDKKLAFIDGTTSTVRMTVTDTGLVGIGTTSPGSALEVKPSSSLSNIGIQAGTINSDSIRLQAGGTANTYLEYRGYLGHAWFVDSTERARIDSSGRLLVNTSTARDNFFGQASGVACVLEIEGTSAATGRASIVKNENDGGASILILGKSRSGSLNGNTIVQSGDQVGGISFQGADGSKLVQAANIIAEIDGTPGANDMPGRLVFSTTADGAGSPTERMRISNNGFAKISNTGTYTNSVGTYHEIRSDVGGSDAFNVTHSDATDPYGMGIYLTSAAPNNTANYFLYCTDSVGQRATIRSNGGLANFSANNVNLSDRNAKKDIAPAAGTWDCLKAWEIVNFHYKDQPDDADLNMGVIAQQVAESCPEVITVFQEATEDQPEKLGVKDQQMMWMAIKALQEAQLRIETLEAEVAALKGV